MKLSPYVLGHGRVPMPPPVGVGSLATCPPPVPVFATRGADTVPGLRTVVLAHVAGS